MNKIKSKLAKSKWLSWVVHRKELWLWQRHTVALGAAIGVSMGLLIPLAQIPVSAVLAFIFRANIGVAAISTLITNPLTFAPVYYGAYKLGDSLTGNINLDTDTPGIIGWFSNVGMPLVTGLAIFSVIGFFLTYSVIFSVFSLMKKPD